MNASDSTSKSTRDGSGEKDANHNETLSMEEVSSLHSPLRLPFPASTAHRTETITKGTSNETHAETSSEGDLGKGKSAWRSLRQSSALTMFELSTCFCVRPRSVLIDFIRGGNAYCGTCEGSAQLKSTLASATSQLAHAINDSINAVHEMNKTRPCCEVIGLRRGSCFAFKVRGLSSGRPRQKSGILLGESRAV